MDPMVHIRRVGLAVAIPALVVALVAAFATEGIGLAVIVLVAAFLVAAVVIPIAVMIEEEHDLPADRSRRTWH